MSKKHESNGFNDVKFRLKIVTLFLEWKNKTDKRKLGINPRDCNRNRNECTRLLEDVEDDTLKRDFKFTGLFWQILRASMLVLIATLEQ